MDELLQTIRTMVCFLVVANLIGYMQPSRIYEKYIKLIIGLMLVLILTAGIIGAVRKDGGIAGKAAETLEEWQKELFDENTITNVINDAEVLRIELNQYEKFLDGQ